MGEALVVDPRKAVQCFRREASARVKELLPGGLSGAPRECHRDVRALRQLGVLSPLSRRSEASAAVVVILAEG